MTLEEAINRASSGDAQCMIIVGDFFGINEELQPDERYKQALPWYEKAASVGSPDGADRAMMIYDIYGAISKEIGAWDRAVDDYSQAYTYANMILKNQNLNREFVDSTIKKKQEYCYQIALCNFRIKNKVLALNLTTNSPELKKYTKAIMLRAVCAFEIAETDDDLYEAQQLLDIYESYDLEPVFSVIQDETEELTLSLGYVYLSIFFHNNDATRAYNIVSSGYDAVHLGMAKEFLVKELNHYKKKLFSGFQYIE